MYKNTFLLGLAMITATHTSTILAHPGHTHIPHQLTHQANGLPLDWMLPILLVAVTVIPWLISKWKK